MVQGGQLPLLPSIAARRPLLEAHKRKASDGHHPNDVVEVNGAGEHTPWKDLQIDEKT